ncbi:MAG: hypothetical protein ACLTLY_05985 [Agathobacter rectalis]
MGEVYLSENFDDVPLGQLLYHLHTPLDGNEYIILYIDYCVGSLNNIGMCFSCVIWILGTWCTKRELHFELDVLLGCIEIAYSVVLVAF